MWRDFAIVTGIEMCQRNGAYGWIVMGLAGRRWLVVPWARQNRAVDAPDKRDIWIMVFIVSSWIDFGTERPWVFDTVRYVVDVIWA